MINEPDLRALCEQRMARDHVPGSLDLGVLRLPAQVESAVREIFENRADVATDADDMFRRVTDCISARLSGRPDAAAAEARDELLRVREQAQQLAGRAQAAEQQRDDVCQQVQRLSQRPVVWTGHVGAVHGVAVSPDQKFIAAADSSGHVRLFDRETEAEVKSFQHPAVRSVAFSHSGEHIASGGQDSHARVWNVASGAAVHAMNHTNHVASVSFSPDGTRVASGGADGHVRTWNTETGASVRAFAAGAAVTSVAWSHDGSKVTSGAVDRAVRIWDAATGAQVRVCSLPGPVHCVAVSRDGRRVVAGCGGGVVCWLDADTLAFARPGSANIEIRGDAAATVVTAAVNSVCFSPCGQHVAFGCADGKAGVLDAATGDVRRLLAGHNCVNGTAWSRDGRTIVSCGNDFLCRIWQWDAPA